MIIIRENICHNCNKTAKTLPYIVTFTEEKKHCKTCGNRENEIWSYELCSQKCLAEFTKKLNNHKHIWAINPIGSGAKIDHDKITAVYAYCKICKHGSWRNEKALLDKYKIGREDWFGKKK